MSDILRSCHFSDTIQQSNAFTVHKRNLTTAATKWYYIGIWTNHRYIFHSFTGKRQYIVIFQKNRAFKSHFICNAVALGIVFRKSGIYRTTVKQAETHERLQYIDTFAVYLTFPDNTIVHKLLYHIIV